VTRESDHGDAGDADDRLIDDWEAEADPAEEPGDVLPDGQLEVADEGELAAIRKEAEILQKAADPDKG
jgi:hypothetical protein